MAVAAVSQVFDVINPEFVTSSLDTESREAGQSRELSKRLFICAAGRWTAVSPMGTLQSGRRTDGRSRVTVLALESLPAFWWRSGWHQGPAGLSNGRGGDHTITHCATLLLRSSGWQGGLLLKSCRLEMAFMWMGGLICIVWQLSLRIEHQVILLFLINKRCLKATMHLAIEHSDFLVALMLFVFDPYSDSHWGDHIHRWMPAFFKTLCEVNQRDVIYDSESQKKIKTETRWSKKKAEVRKTYLDSKLLTPTERPFGSVSLFRLHWSLWKLVILVILEFVLMLLKIQAVYFWVSFVSWGCHLVDHKETKNYSSTIKSSIT